MGNNILNKGNKVNEIDEKKTEDEIESHDIARDESSKVRFDDEELVSESSQHIESPNDEAVVNHQNNMNAADVDEHKDIEVDHVDNKQIKDEDVPSTSTDIENMGMNGHDIAAIGKPDGLTKDESMISEFLREEQMDNDSMRDDKEDESNDEAVKGSNDVDDVLRKAHSFSGSTAI